MAITAGIALTGATGLAKSVGGFLGLDSTQDKIDALVRPVKTIEKEWLDNRSLSMARANSGMSDQAKDLYISEGQRGLGASLSATLQGGGSLNLVQDLYSDYDRGMQELAVKDVELQNRNVLHYMDQNKQVAGQHAMNWVTNELDPYKDKMQSLTSQAAAHKQNAWSGLSDVAGAVTSFGVAEQNSDLIDLNKAKGGSGAPTMKSISASLTTGDPFPITPTPQTLPTIDVPAVAKNLRENMSVTDMLDILGDEEKAQLSGILNKAINRPQ